MVQLFYYENRGRCARRILRHDLASGCSGRWTSSGSSASSGVSRGNNNDGCRVMLYPDEGWARPAGLSYLLLQPVWWSRTRCRVLELSGTRRWTAVARMSVSAGNGSHVIVVGKFKEVTGSAAAPSSSTTAASHTTTESSPASTSGPSTMATGFDVANGGIGRYFKLTLSTDVSNADFQLGYCMTGTMERGDRKSAVMEMTHYAMVKRKGYWCDVTRLLWRHDCGVSSIGLTPSINYCSLLLCTHAVSLLIVIPLLLLYAHCSC